MVPRETLTAEHFFDLSDVWFRDLFQGKDFPWMVLEPGFKESWIRKTCQANVKTIPCEGTMVAKTTKIAVGGGEATVEAGSFLIGGEIEIRKGVVIEAGAWVAGPTILGEGTVVRHGAYVRGGVVTGKDAVIGHATEIKASLLLNGAKAPHFAYVGDSILGNQVNLGAGTKVSNLKITNDEVILRIGDNNVPTGLRKLGALIGDQTETGCNSVLNPGVLLGKKCLVFPSVAVRKNYYKSGSAIK